MPGETFYSYTCDTTDGEKKVYSFRKAWTLPPPVEYCEVKSGAGVRITGPENDALTLAYGKTERDSLDTLYSLCAEVGAYYGTPGNNLSEAQADEARGMLALCPDHPDAVQIQSNIQSGAEEDEARADGKLLSSGKYLVPSEATPGTWETLGDRVEDCYWEVSSKNGDIIDNGFISVAAKATAYVPASAGGFHIEGCGFRWIGP